MGTGHWFLVFLHEVWLEIQFLFFPDINSLIVAIQLLLEVFIIGYGMNSHAPWNASFLENLNFIWWS